MDQKPHSLKSTTRTFETTKGLLTYAELSEQIAPNLLGLIYNIADSKYADSQLDEDLIRNFHYKIVGDIMPQIAGKWRNVPVMVGNWFPPEPYMILMRMREYVKNLQTRIDNANTHKLQIEALAYAEGEFLSIHPFQDFNGRTIRALLMEIMRRLDIPDIDTSVKRNTPEFRSYQNALAEYDNGRLNALIKIWEDRLEHINFSKK